MPHPPLPPELLDYIVDHLYDTRDTLENCCLVSKLWAHRTRKHLFAVVKFRTEEDVQAWKNAFPDPSTSPAHYTRSLSVWCVGAVTAADAEERGWISVFSRVVHFDVEFDGPKNSLLPFHGFSPVLKSIHVDYSHFPCSQILNFVHSFPLIEDLSLLVWSGDLIDDTDGQPTTVQPPLTGMLNIDAHKGMEHITPQLFPPQNGLHFRKLDLGLFCEHDVLVTSTLVERCSLTLESLEVCGGNCDESSLGAIDLSKAVGLKDLALKWECDPRWVATTLRTITPSHRNLQQILLEIQWKHYVQQVYASNPADLEDEIGETLYRGWLELDEVLSQLWESHSIHSEVACIIPGEAERIAGCQMESLLPKAAKRGIIYLIDQRDRW